MLERVVQFLQIVHRHPAAMRTTLAGGTDPGRGRLEKLFAWRRLSHLVKDALIGRDDKCLGVERLGSLD